MPRDGESSGRRHAVESYAAVAQLITIPTYTSEEDTQALNEDGT
ncbi:MAG: hypothetical protein WAN72_08290 [Candidatus Acidiferrales bacterium]